MGKNPNHQETFLIRSPRFTGERVTRPEDAVFPEHLARYQFASQYLAGKQVLDVACGLGLGSALLAKTAQKVFGVDVDQNSIAYARKQYQNNPRLTFQVGEANKLPFPDNFFDLIVSLETIEHVADYSGFLAESQRILKADGLLILSTPDRETTKKILIDIAYQNPFHLHEFSRQELKELLGQRFEIKGWYGQFRYQASPIRKTLRNLFRLLFQLSAGRKLKSILPLKMVLWTPRILSGISRDCRVHPLKEDQEAQSLIVVCQNRKQTKKRLQGLQNRAGGSLPPKAGVTIVTFNAQSYIEACLSSLLANTYRNFEVVVVDNASLDRTSHLVQTRFPRTHLIQNQGNLGFAKGTNRGLRYLLDQECTSFLLLNADTVVNKDLLEKLIKALSNYPEAGIVGPVITYLNQPDKIWFAGGEFNQTFAYARHPYQGKKLKQINLIDKKTDFVTGCCLMTKKEVFEKIGFLNESLGYYFEDVFFCLKAQEAGFASYLVAEPLVKHHPSTSLGKAGKRLSSLQAYYFGRNPLLIIAEKTQKRQKFTNILGQFLIRLPYYTYHFLRQRQRQALFSYLGGLRDGLAYFRKDRQR